MRNDRRVSGFNPRRAMLLVPLASAMLLAALASAAVTTAQDPKPADATLDDQINEFKEAISERDGEQDQKAIGLIDAFNQKYKDLEKKDQSDVRKVLDDALTSTRIRRPPEKIGMYTAAAAALGGMGDDGARILKKAFDSSKFKKREWVDLRAVLLKWLGKTKDESMIKTLTDVARRDPEDKLMAAAGEALGNFADQPLKVRKDIVKDLINKFGEVHGKANASLDPGDAQVARSKQRLAAISDPWNETLKMLTKHEFRSAPEWQTFWNKEKGENWDK